MCGAANAASRRRCGRCHAPLHDDDVAPVAAASADEGFGPTVRARADSGAPRWLLSAIALAAVVVLLVTGTLLGARGIGPLAPASPGAGTRLLGIAEATASSALSPAVAALAADGDPATAWVEGAPGPGGEEWLELRLARTALVHRLVLWNGDQSGDALFARRNRVGALRIELGGQAFRVELLDSQGGQTVALPRPVRAERVRLVIIGIHRGRLGAETALAGVEVYGTPAE